MTRIEHGAGHIPQHFNPHTLEIAKQIPSVLADGVARVAISSPDSPDSGVATVSQHLAANAASLMPKEHDELGTIRGKLERLDTHGAYTFSVWDAVTGHKVDCVFPEDRYEEVLGLVRRRVDVSGRIRYTGAGLPYRVIVEEIRELPDHYSISELLNGPPMNLTGGLEEAEYVRRLRDEV